MAAAAAGGKPLAATVAPRRDPVRRHVDGTSPWNRIVNRDKNLHYVWVHKGSQEFGVDYYAMLGYEPVRAGVDAARPAGGMVTQRAGELVEMRGHVLMACPVEKRDEIERVGLDGQSGQEEVDRIEALIIKKRGGMDPLRGIRVQGRDGDPIMTFVNETSGPIPEFG